MPPAPASRSMPDAMPEDREITFERIRERAYELWDRNHRPEGLEVRFWLLAERELKTEQARGPTPEVATTASSSEGT